jgi:hypothetical protein
MAWYPDLSPCDYFGAECAPYLAAVGWLSREHPYPREPVDGEFLARLNELVVFRGWHDCEFCDLVHRRVPVRFPDGVLGSYSERVAGHSEGANLFVPAQGFLYAAPAMIGHYVREHGYAPPPAFREAVLECPLMGSAEYFRRIPEPLRSAWRVESEQEPGR